MYWASSSRASAAGVSTGKCGEFKCAFKFWFKLKHIFYEIKMNYLVYYETYGATCDESSGNYYLCYTTDTTLLYCNNGVATNCSCPTTVSASPSKCDW